MELATISERPKMPFIIELPKDRILTCLQDQVNSPIDPESLAYDTEGFSWEEGDIVLHLTFKDEIGVGHGMLYLKAGINKDLGICFVVDAQFIEYLPASEGVN